MPDPVYCPEYRLRLFLSADLAGSTAYKAGAGALPVTAGDPQPQWVQKIREFYREFPRLVEQFNRTADGVTAEAEGFPRIWKTVGDEIVFCCRIVSLDHLSRCVSGFLRALADFGTSLENAGQHLDIKGAGWLCTFPAPNVTVALDNRPLTADQFDESFEQAADQDPRGVDFLGNGIDCGFRIAQHSATDRFVVSVELAWLLAEAARRRIFTSKFAYHGRHILKGVLRNRPYPLISVDTERSFSRREVRDRERLLSGSQEPNPMSLRDFLQSFMEDERIDFPVLPGAGGSIPSELPGIYVQYRDAWHNTVRELVARGSLEAVAAQIDPDGGNLPAGLEQTVEGAIDEARQSHGSLDRDTTPSKDN